MWRDIAAIFEINEENDEKKINEEDHENKGRRTRKKKLPKNMKKQSFLEQIFKCARGIFGIV